MYSNKLLKIILATMISISTVTAAGKVSGATSHEAPSWFKESFLDMSEDIEEASEEGKHVMLFMDLDSCPYCTRMLKESFIKDGETKAFAKNHFDVININIKGSKEIAWDEDTDFTEKELAIKLKVQYSPTVLFLDNDKNIVVRVNGYRSAKNFKNIMEYVNGKHYKNMKLGLFLDKVKAKNLYTLKENKLFTSITDLSKITSPLAIIFEDGSCTQCDYLHNTTFKNKDVLAELSAYTIVRLDASDTKTIITPNGEKISAKQWANKINLDYRPGILLYNEKELISTVDALLYSFHFKELLRYVSTKQYKVYGGYLQYLSVRQSKLIKKGININLAK